jgi:hypothetical protein
VFFCRLKPPLGRVAAGNLTALLLKQESKKMPARIIVLDHQDLRLHFARSRSLAGQALPRNASMLTGFCPDEAVLKTGCRGVSSGGDAF